MLKKEAFQGIPGGSVVNNPPANAGDVGLTDPGRAHVLRNNWAHGPQLLSLRSKAEEPQLLSPRSTATEARSPWGLCSATAEATTMRSPHTTAPQLEKSQCSSEDPA